jgi:hypothetical protein
MALFRLWITEYQPQSASKSPIKKNLIANLNPCKYLATQPTCKLLKIKYLTRHIPGGWEPLGKANRSQHLKAKS